MAGTCSVSSAIATSSSCTSKSLSDWWRLSATLGLNLYVDSLAARHSRTAWWRRRVDCVRCGSRRFCAVICCQTNKRPPLPARLPRTTRRKRARRDATHGETSSNSPTEPRKSPTRMAASVCKTLAGSHWTRMLKARRNKSRRELHLTKTHQSQMGRRWAAQRVGSEGKGRGEASTVMVETHAWIVARSASGTSERAAGGSVRLWERPSERARRRM